MKKELSPREKANASQIGEKSSWDLPPIRSEPRPRYPWSERYDSPLLPITSAHFQCRGSSLHPPIFYKSDETLFDCNGTDEHTLPMHEGADLIPHELIEVLNYVQRVANKPLHITAGHRCPKHQRYINPSYKAQFSKHLIGAEVTFYIEEMPAARLIELIQNFYKNHPLLKKDTRYTTFERYTKDDTDVSTLPWYNRELFIKLYKSHEGRDLDNNHKYPYVSIQMRYNRKGERIRYTHEVALHSVQTK